MGPRYSNSHGIMTLACACVFLFAGRPAVCEDCNGNGVPDDQDISVGTSEDCNLNGIPDECEAYVMQQKLMPLEDIKDSFYGEGLAFREDVIVVGAPFAWTNGLQWSGAAYVFRYNGTSWAQEAKLIPSDGPELYAQFGTSYAIGDDLIVVGNPGNDGGDFSYNKGAAYVFRYDSSSWVEEAKLTASDAVNGDLFGKPALSDDGNMLLIGAGADDDGGKDTGSVYVFQYDGSGWVETAKLHASNPDPEAYFGAYLEISGDVALISANYEDSYAVNTGTVYVFRYDGSGWIETAKLTASDAKADDRFGGPVHISGDVALMGAQSDDYGKSSCSAYVFRYNGTSWIEEAKLTASDAVDKQYFGIFNDISGDVAVIGAYGDNNRAGIMAGAAYVFRYDGTSWIETAKIIPSDLIEYDHLGRRVAIDGNRVAIAASSTIYQPNATPKPGDHEGSVYVYHLPDAASEQDFNGNGVPDNCEPDCNDNGIPDDYETNYGMSPDCNLNGVPDECDITDGTSQDCDSNGIPDECDLDCNNNGVGDGCDILDGTSQDCNSNGIPDECDTGQSGSSIDCNGNRIPDECEPDCNGNGLADGCDIAWGKSQDSNSNGIPDECELPGPMVTSAVSVKAHGTAGEFGIDVLDRTNNADIEGRRYGVTKLVVGFDMDIQGVDGLDKTDVSLTPVGSVDSVILSASNELTIAMSSTPNGIPMTVTFPGIARASDVLVVCTDSVCIRQLVGDVRPDGSINAGDRVDVRNQVEEPVTAGNFRADVRADGTINLADRIDVRNAVGSGFVGTCP